MKARTMSLVGALVVSLVGVAGTGAATISSELEETSIGVSDTSGVTSSDIDDTYRRLPPSLTDTIDTLGADGCEFGLKILQSQGWDVPENRDELGYEYEPISGQCKDFRDALTHRVWNDQDPPYAEYCNYNLGVNCVAVGHYACDFALLADSGFVYICMGGITPYN